MEGTYYRICSVTTTVGTWREVYGKQGGGTGDVHVIEHPPLEYILPHGTLTHSQTGSTN